MKTLQDFADECVNLSNYEIFCLYESGISKSLKTEIMKLKDPSSPEPTRSALIKLGYMFGVRELIDY